MCSGETGIPHGLGHRHYGDLAGKQGDDSVELFFTANTLTLGADQNDSLFSGNP